MKAGNSTSFITILFYFMFIFITNAEEKILSSPLINLDDLKPSFEEVDETVDENSIHDNIKDKEVKLKSNKKSAIFIGLDKITAKTSEIIINMGEWFIEVYTCLLSIMIVGTVILVLIQHILEGFE